jgi:outer membrane protein OmpA-like peptidoglycan-associated protein
VPIPAPPRINVAPHQTTTLPDDSTVGFVANKAVFRNPAAATSVLTPLAQFLAANPQVHVKVTGTTARVGDRNGQIALANDRAHAVMTVLLQKGAHQDQITTEGLGSYFPGYVPDHAPDGTLLADKAQQNRTVILSW